MLAAARDVTTLLLLTASVFAAAAPSTVQVERGAFRRVVILTCELRAERAGAITSPRGLPGSGNFTIADMAEDGAVVAEGDVVLRFDDREVAQQRLTRDSELVTTRADIEIRELEAESRMAELRAQLALAEARLSKAALDAAADPSVTSASALSDAGHELESARVELAQKQGGLEAARREAAADLAILRIKADAAMRARDEADRILASFAVRAPLSGIAVRAQDMRNDRAMVVGAVVWSGATVLTVQDPARMWAECELDQSDRRVVAIDQPVELRVDAHPESPFPGKVRSISAFAEPLTRGWWDRSDVRIFKLAVAIDGSDPRLLKPGLTARADVRVHESTDALLLPRAAVRRDHDGEFVLVSGQRRPIVVAVENPIHALIGSGLSEGDVVDLP